MIYSDKYNFVFYPLPKTATCSLWELLAIKYDAIEYPQDHTLGRHVMTLPKGDFEGYLSFTVVRHPFSRARSLWNHCQRLEGFQGNFEDFVWDHLVPRTTWLCQTQSEWLVELHVDHVLKMEKLQDDFHSLPFVYTRDIPFKNRGDRKHEEISMKSHLGIIEWAEEDFRQFDYHHILV